MDVIKEVRWQEVNKFMKELDKRKINYGMITEWGACVSDDDLLVIELGEDIEKNYISTRGFVQRSEDGVFVRLMKDGKKEKMPNFEDIFEIVDLSDTHKEIRIKDELEKND